MSNADANHPAHGGQPLAQCLERYKNVDEKLDRILRHLDGNGSPGLVVRLDRLEQNERRRNWWMRSVVGGTLALAIERLFQHFHK